MYKGIDITKMGKYYTVQDWEGDEIVFETEEEAKAFIDNELL